jgi:hypothetical protein
LRGEYPVAAAPFDLDELGVNVRTSVVQMEDYWRGFLAGLVGEAAEGGHLWRDAAKP